MGLSPRSRLAFALLGILLSITTMAIAATVIQDGKQAGPGVSFNQQSGPNVTVGHQLNFTTTNPWQTTDQITLEPYANFTSTQNTHVRVAQINGTWTNLTHLNVTQAPLEVDVNDKQTVAVSGDTKTLNYTAMALDDGQVDFVYSGTTGTTTLTIQGLPANTTVGAIDTQTQDLLDGATTNGAGTVTLQGMPNSEHTVTLQTSNANYPSLSNPHPEGKLSTYPSTLAIDVTDADFPSDNVTVEFYLDGTKVGTKYATSNGEVNVSIPQPSRGSHSVRVVATDGYNQSTETSWSFAVPNEIQLKNETSPSQNITVPVNATFYTISGDPIFTATTSDGSINMTGLPPLERYIVEFKPQGGDYLDRTAYVGDITEQHTFYLINGSTTTTSSLKFTLTDLTGNYPQDTTVIYAQRALNVSNQTQWQTVAGATFGADGARMTLTTNVRYRLVIENGDGDVRSVGSFTPSGDQTVPITIGDIKWDSPEGDTYQIDAWLVNESSTDYLKFAYSDPEDATSSLTLRIHEQGKPGSPIYSVTESGLGNYTEQVALPRTNVTWIANVTLTRNGETQHHRIPLGQPGGLPLPIEEKWLTPMIYLFLVGVMSATPKASARTGALLVASLGILVWWFGWAPLSGPAVGVAGAIALIGKAGDYAEKM